MWKKVDEFADELFEWVWPFCGIGASRVKLYQLPIFMPTQNWKINIIITKIVDKKKK